MKCFQKQKRLLELFIVGVLPENVQKLTPRFKDLLGADAQKLTKSLRWRLKCCDPF